MLPRLKSVGMVPYIDAFDQENDVLGDVGRVVAYALQIARHEDEFDGCRHRVRIVLHRFLKLRINPVTLSVDFIVREQYGARQPGISFDKRLQTPEEHRLHRSEERRVGKECRSRWWPCH